MVAGHRYLGRMVLWEGMSEWIERLGLYAGGKRMGMGMGIGDVLSGKRSGEGVERGGSTGI